MGLASCGNERKVKVSESEKINIHFIYFAGAWWLGTRSQQCHAMQQDKALVPRHASLCVRYFMGLSMNLNSDRK